jgi:hypothetical protein
VDVTGTARRWAKWLGEALLPRVLFTPGLPKASPAEIRITTLPLDEAARLAARRARRSVMAVLDPALCLRRTVELPSAVGAKSEAAIALQLRQTLPGQGQGLVWRCKESGRAGRQIGYDVYILRQSQLDALITELRGLGADVAAVSVAERGLEPLWQQSPVGATTVKNWKAFTALTVATIGLLAVVGIELKRQQFTDLVAARSERTAALEGRLTATRAKAEDGKERAAGILNDMQLYSDQARRLRVLTDLTEALPDTVWISELSISGNQMVLSGFAEGEVTDVISRIQSVPWASDVALNGAISYDGYSGQNRFELGMTIIGDDPA